MKYLILPFLLLTFTNNVFCQNNIAVVNKIQGFYIFNDCLPLSDYDVIGEISTDGNTDKEIKMSKGQYIPVRDFLIKSARQVNYNADGLIITLVNNGIDKAVIIKFKDANAKNNQAKVNQYQGVYVFVDNEPLTPNEYIGTVKTKGKLTRAQYSSVRDNLLDRCKIDFSGSRAMVLKFVNGGNDTGDVIKFSK
jgi:hypothetical protein